MPGAFFRRAARLCSRAAAVALPAGGIAGSLALGALPFSPVHAQEQPQEADAGGDRSAAEVAALSSQLSLMTAELDALRQRTAELAASDADAARLQRAVQKQEEEDSLKLLRLLQQQELVWERVMAERAAADRERLAREHEAAQAQLAQECAAAQDAAVRAREEELLEAHEADKEALRISERAAHEAERTAESRERLARLAALHENVEALDKAYSFDAEYKQRSHGVHKLVAALFAVEEALRGAAGAKLGPRLQALRAAAPDDPVVGAAVGALPAAVLEADRVPTLRELQQRFDTVASQGRVASYVPEGTGILGQVVGAAVATLSFRDRGLVEATDAAAVYARADHFVAREQIADAVRELEALRGLPRTVAQDWMDAAKARCALEQSVTLLRAHATTLTCALA